MTRLMKRTSLLACLAALILLVGGGSTFAANPANDETGLISVKFAGGSVTDYFEALVKEAGPINVVVAPEANDVPMPPVTLMKVTVSAAIGLVDGRTLTQPGRIVRLDVRQMPQYHQDEQPTFQVQAEVRGERVLTSAGVWTIASLLRGDVFDSDDVLAAVETALDVLESASEPIIRFHKETGLLIARGDGNQLSAIENVLGQLAQSQHEMSRKPMQELQGQNAALKTELANAEARAADLTIASDNARGELRRYRIQFETLMARLAETERMLKDRDQQLDGVTNLLRQTQSALERGKSDDDRKSGRDNS